MRMTSATSGQFSATSLARFIAAVFFSIGSATAVQAQVVYENDFETYYSSAPASGADAGWGRDSASAYAGGYSLKSGYITSGEVAATEIVVDSLPATMSFWQRYSASDSHG